MQIYQDILMGGGFELCDSSSLAATLEPLAHHQNIANLSLFYRYYLARCAFELAQLVPLPQSLG